MRFGQGEDQHEPATTVLVEPGQPFSVGRNVDLVSADLGAAAEEGGDVGRRVAHPYHLFVIEEQNRQTDGPSGNGR